MYVLNTVRDEPVKAKAILEFIDEKRRRMFETEFSKEKKEERPKQNPQAHKSIPTNPKTNAESRNRNPQAQKSIPNKPQKKLEWKKEL